jgi:hypothetical protein
VHYATWNGASWTGGSLPDPKNCRATGSPPIVTSAAAFSPDDVWAMGYCDTESPLPYVANFNDVLATSPASVWVVGMVPSLTTGTSKPGAVYWNGHTWTAYRIDSKLWLTSVASDGAGGLWACSELEGMPYRLPTMWHFTAGQWQQASVKSLTRKDYISQLALVPGSTSVWAADSSVIGTGVGRMLLYGDVPR